MRYALSAILGIALVACSSVQPVQIHAGDICAGCKRPITEPKLGAELLADDGTAAVFGAPGCLANYLKDHSLDGRSILVTDYATGEFISVANALFVKAKIDEVSGERDFYAFRKAADASKFAEDKVSAVIDWSAVRQQAAAKTKAKGN
jgi:hypothetical protein